jgi:hypothetical protein
MTRHCHNCGQEWPYDRQPGRSEICEKCSAELHVCLNCARYDRAVAQQCRETRAEPVADKDRANFCDWFEFARRNYSPDDAGNRRADQAREQFRRLFGD